MEYRKLGRTGFEVSGVGHGLWGMSGWSGSSDEESLAALQLAVDLGCNFFDTAWAYGEGKSDGLLGEIMARNPKQRLYAASKIPPANDRWPALPEYKYQDVFSPKHVFKYADKIRKQLRTDTIDLLQFHVWDDSWTNEPDFRSTVEKLKHDGAVRAALGKSAEPVSVDLGWVLPPTSDVDDADGEFEKSPTIVRGDGRRTLGKKLGITRVDEIVTQSGDKWLHGFNAANELIDARLLESAE